MNNQGLALILTGIGSEFFSVNDRAYVVHKGKNVPIEEAPKAITSALQDFINSDKERAEAYEKMAGRCMVAQMSQCVKCMFAVLDGTPDVDENGKISNTEFVPCEKRFICEFYGVGCNKLVSDNGNEISKGELRVLELYNMEEKDIADRLFLSTKTVSRHSQNIRFKTGIKKDKQLALWALNKGVINQSQLCAY